MLSEKMEAALNDQINKEFFSAYLYLAMSAYVAREGFSGAATWLKMQHDEEMEHMQKFFDYVVARGGKVRLNAVDEPQGDYSSLLEVFKQVLEHEQLVTASINELTALSLELRDFATNALLQWFVSEQVEEEDTAGDIVHRLELVGNDGRGLLMLDEQLGARVAPSAAE